MRVDGCKVALGVCLAGEPVPGIVGTGLPQGLNGPTRCKTRIRDTGTGFFRYGSGYPWKYLGVTRAMH